jgi:hypothetical protein
MGYSRGHDNYDIDVETYLKMAIFPKDITYDQKLSEPDENGIIKYLIDKKLPSKGDNIGYAQIVKNTTDITYSKMTEEKSTYNNKTIKEIIKEIIDEIDTSNAASAVVPWAEVA